MRDQGTTMPLASAGNTGTMGIGAMTTRASDGWFDRTKQTILARFCKAGVRRMELVERLDLGGRRQLMLVICDGHTYLVGAGNDAIHAITRVGVKPEDNPLPGDDAPCDC